MEMIAMYYNQVKYTILILKQDLIIIRTNKNQMRITEEKRIQMCK